MSLRNLLNLSVFSILAVALLSSPRSKAQNLTLEGQTGGFITPTAYVVYSAKKQFFSYPAVGYHFVNSSKVIGNIHTFNIAEGFGNRAELGYTRSVHQDGHSPLFSQLWHYAGMNIFNGKVVLIKDGQGSPLTPGLAVGFVVRTGDRFVTGALDDDPAGRANSPCWSPRSAPATAYSRSYRSGARSSPLTARARAGRAWTRGTPG